MENSPKIDLSSVAKILDLPEEQVRSAARLLEEGNTIPFITRFRKDETNGIGEPELRSIKQEISRLTALVERKAFILRAIENQDRLTDDLRSRIEQCNQSRSLEDLYLPFKPKKTSLAEVARQQGLEPLARDILDGHQPDIDLASRATDFVRVDKGLNTVDEVIKGVRHILAERYSEHIQLRKQLRKVYWQTGSIQTQLVEPVAETKEPAATTEDKTVESPSVEDKPADETADNPTDNSAPMASGARQQEESQHDQLSPAESTASQSGEDPEDGSANESPATTGVEPATEPVTSVMASGDSSSTIEPGVEEVGIEEIGKPPLPVKPDGDSVPTGAESTSATDPAETSDPAAAAKAPESTTDAKPKKKRKKKKKKTRPDPFAEFAGFSELLQKIPPHRTLAINRGERANKLKVRLFVEPEKLGEIAKRNLVPEGHAFAEFLATACDDAMNRLILPSIEREIRRDLSERAEAHAVKVFSRNLRHLFLQPPVRGKRIMGIDPGYRSGCKMAVIDETGRPLGHGVFSIVGNKERIESNRKRLIDLINEHQPQLIAIGNGSGCRAVEQFVSDVISGELADRHLKYTIVNQAGTSAYSTSEIGQRDLPDHDPVIRSAISISRRLQDPLSELVKVNPANVGVGLYQHDIKAKHLSDSLENVVESCVNYVGVNANTASTSLLRYVSGLGQTTARNLVEHRNCNGPFAQREKLKEVSGLGEVSFVQSAGFLRIDDGENALDQTLIHPEDYPVAQKILDRLSCKVAELIPPAVEVRRHVAAPVQPALKATDEPTLPVNVVVESTEAPTEPSQDSGEPATQKLSESAVVQNSAVESSSAAEPPVAESIAPASEKPEIVENATPAEPATPTETTAPAEPAAPTESAAATESAAPITNEIATSEPPVAPVPPPTVPALSPEQIAECRQRRRELVEKIKELKPADLAREFGVGEMKVRDILRALRNPAQDPREDKAGPVFRKGILKFDDLKQGMELRGQIVNVVDFGVFLNIGIGESCLVHISRLANRFVRDPHWFYAVGDVLKVWVQEVDAGKRRVTLTAIRPDSHKKESRKPGPKRETGGRPHGRRSGVASRGNSKRHGAGKGKPHHKRPPRKPKPVKPITDEMVDGKEPMRSFSDLLQFHKRKTDDDTDSKS